MGVVMRYYLCPSAYKFWWEHWWGTFLKLFLLLFFLALPRVHTNTWTREITHSDVRLSGRHTGGGIKWRVLRSAQELEAWECFVWNDQCQQLNNFPPYPSPSLSVSTFCFYIISLHVTSSPSFPSSVCILAVLKYWKQLRVSRGNKAICSLYFLVNISTTVFSYSRAVQYHNIARCGCYCTGPGATRYPSNHNVL